MGWIIQEKLELMCLNIMTTHFSTVTFTWQWYWIPVPIILKGNSVTFHSDEFLILQPALTSDISVKCTVWWMEWKQKRKSLLPNLDNIIWQSNELGTTAASKDSQPGLGQLSLWVRNDSSTSYASSMPQSFIATDSNMVVSQGEEK